MSEEERLRAERDAWREIAEARSKLLACYRMGTQRGSGPPLDRIKKAEAKLAKLAAARPAQQTEEE